jgi:hypothetical protein
VTNPPDRKSAGTSGQTPTPSCRFVGLAAYDFDLAQAASTARDRNNIGSAVSTCPARAAEWCRRRSGSGRLFVCGRAGKRREANPRHHWTPRQKGIFHRNRSRKAPSRPHWKSSIDIRAPCGISPVPGSKKRTANMSRIVVALFPRRKVLGPWPVDTHRHFHSNGPQNPSYGDPQRTKLIESRKRTRSDARRGRKEEIK